MHIWAMVFGTKSWPAYLASRRDRLKLFVVQSNGHFLEIIFARASNPVGTRIEQNESSAQAAVACTKSQKRLSFFFRDNLKKEEAN
ncbi:unnamed protein product [Blepharisma stoltei]|uniref:Uncharacterized protein n=1 Tax=Blepharisma stoltei TaxID=1481888 RepID=A0AAU9J219_9CILI|nr:unnamed protein product [Blepharisma stoltei]